MHGIVGELTKHPVATELALTGTIVVARDIAHARFKELIDRGEELPPYLKDHPVSYAGPAKTPPGKPSGSFGAAAILAEENIRKVECIDYPELGMEAVWRIDVVDFPAFVLVDDKGNDFFEQPRC